MLGLLLRLQFLSKPGLRMFTETPYWALVNDVEPAIIIISIYIYNDEFTVETDVKVNLR